MKRVFISDCEGPITKNDNALETTCHFVPDGDRIFTTISQYDDVLADVLKRPSYRAGDTVKLVLPFLKAYGVTDHKMREFAAHHMRLITNANEMLAHIRGIAPAFIVSTSYEHYIEALCRTVKFPFEDTYCTRFSLDEYRMSDEEKADLKRIACEIASMPNLDVCSVTAMTKEDLTEKDMETVRRLDEFFGNEVGRMETGRIYSEVKTIGGREKAEAVIDIAAKTDADLSETMYVGDSITDEEAFKLVRQKGGLTVSFNGNQYAVRNAEVAVMSSDATVTAAIANVFIRFGKEETLRFVQNWERRTLQETKADKDLVSRLLTIYPTRLPKAQIVGAKNVETLVRESTIYRKRIRGRAVGGLG